MRLEARKYLYDMQRAADLLTEFTTGKAFADYERDAMLRAACFIARLVRHFNLQDVSAAEGWLRSNQKPELLEKQ